MCEEEKDMGALAENRNTKRSKLWELAKKNTTRNKDGLTVLTKDSPYREETGWESTVKDLGKDEA